MDAPEERAEVFRARVNPEASQIARKELQRHFAWFRSAAPLWADAASPWVLVQQVHH